MAFPDGLGVLVELDGPHHFWSEAWFFTNECCQRDLEKERWAINVRSMCVVRVLQEDVWEDRTDWQVWITKCIEEAKKGGLRIFTPDTPEYRSDESQYAAVHECAD